MGEERSSRVLDFAHFSVISRFIQALKPGVLPDVYGNIFSNCTRA